VELFDGLGVEEQAAPRAEILLDSPVAVSTGDDASLVASPRREGLAVSYTLDYRRADLPAQHASFEVSADRFRAEIAPARTFCLESEAKALRAAGLGKGATPENTLVVGEGGHVGTALRFPDEMARHKALDVLGDLFLLGADLRGHVHAFRTGHEANLALVRAILERPEARLGSPTPSRIALSPTQIRRILPHRYPFLLVDRVLEIDGFRRAVGIKNVTVNEPFFQGHWPDVPVMPGVLIIEAMAQVSSMLVFGENGEPNGRLAFLTGIEKAKFRNTVVPGDQMVIKAEMVHYRDNACKVQAVALTDDVVAAEAVMTFALMEIDA
jgi:UDP-3-O-[3-hydroxymyristoyl] N-acetylglucosamine deacetylase/3-hydroxyacyl-[acyl-carrier-protein] dehydratase